MQSKSDTIEKAYKLYSEELYLYAFSLTKDAAWAQDLVSDTFYKALLSYDTNNNQNFKHWLFFVLKNIFIDDYRKRKRLMQFDEKHMVVYCSENGMINQMIKSEEAKRLYDGLLKLEPPLYREIIYLFYFQDLKISQIAKQLSLSQSKVKVILHRARLKLKVDLKGE